MRCKKHFADCSSAVGVCASCLRERLLTLIETHSKYQAQVVPVKPQIEDERRKSDAIPQQIKFPNSVSPYISRRKSDNTTTAAWPHLQHSLSEQQRFYNTPQIGPNGIILTSETNLRDSRTKKFKFSSVSNLFRSKTSKFETVSDFDVRAKPKKSHSIISTTTETVAESPSSWFSNFFTTKKKKKLHIDSMNFADECGDKMSGYSSESSPKETPIRATPNLRRQNQGRNVVAFCLSPLVRPSPKRSLNKKGTLPDQIVIQRGEMRVSPARPNLGVAASFRANRSRKLANFGRFRPDY